MTACCENNSTFPHSSASVLMFPIYQRYFGHSSTLLASRQLVSFYFPFNKVVCTFADKVHVSHTTITPAWWVERSSNERFGSYLLARSWNALIESFQLLYVIRYRMFSLSFYALIPPTWKIFAILDCFKLSFVVVWPTELHYWNARTSFSSVVNSISNFSVEIKLAGIKLGRLLLFFLYCQLNIGIPGTYASS